MRFVLTAIILAGGVMYLFLGASFLIDPTGAAGGFGLSATGNTGLATLRADMFAFFGIAGLTMIIGAWQRNGDVLLVPAVLFMLALLGRIVSAFADGPGDGMWLAMAVETVSAVILLIASRVLPHPET